MPLTRNQIILAVAGVVTLGSLGLCVLGGGYGLYEYMARRERQRVADEVQRAILGVPPGDDVDEWKAQALKDNAALNQAMIDCDEAEKTKDPQKLRDADIRLKAISAEIKARREKAKK